MLQSAAAILGGCEKKQQASGVRKVELTAATRHLISTEESA